MPTFENVQPSLRRAFREGRLEVLVGAGASVPSGLPSWNELNRRLLRRFLGREYQDLDFEAQDLDPAADIFVNSFGREAVVDVVRSRLQPEDYISLLRDALYETGEKDVSSIHLEIAAMLGGNSGLHRVFTFNFDSLIEEASRRFLPLPAVSVVNGLGPSYREQLKSVIHLHGLLPPPDRGPACPPLVLSERDYYAAEGDWASRALRKLFQDPDATVLMVGLSLSDARLRKLLLERMERARNGKPIADVVALVSSSKPVESQLIERLARRFVRQHAAEYWKTWKMSVVTVDAHALVPFHLRQIRLGESPRRWCDEGSTYLRRSLPVVRNLYQPDVQLSVLRVMAEILRLIRRKFGVISDEELHLGAYVTAPGGFLRLAYCYRGGELKTDIVGADRAKARSLRIGGLDKVQGASGRALILGTTVETTRRDPLLDLNFTPEMATEWTRDRAFSALLSVPVYDSSFWLPVGVVYLTSNQLRPFWTELSHGDFDDLETILRNSFDVALTPA